MSKKAIEESKFDQEFVVTLTFRAMDADEASEAFQDMRKAIANWPRLQEVKATLERSKSNPGQPS